MIWLSLGYTFNDNTRIKRRRRTGTARSDHRSGSREATRVYLDMTSSARAVQIHSVATVRVFPFAALPFLHGDCRLPNSVPIAFLARARRLMTVPIGRPKASAASR